MSKNFHLITGCSSGGKSTLLAALAVLGHHVVPEAGRRIVAAEQAGTGNALPWGDMHAFARKAILLAKEDLEKARGHVGPVFFDRGVIDAAVALEHAGGPSCDDTLGSVPDYNKRVILAPPWPEIFVQDSARKHGFAAATEEYHRIKTRLIALGYEVCLLPKADVDRRVAHVLRMLACL